MKILIVDDNAGFLNVMAGLLRDQGYEVLTAEDGKKAREILEGETVELIISDIMMPTLDGSRFHSYVREFAEASDVPFIFISAFDDDHTRRLVVDSEIDFFVSKTAPVDTILDLITSIQARRDGNADAAHRLRSTARL